jgi:N-acetyl sugar amidotransferase
MKVCRKCLIESSHPYGVTFDSKGLCTGCLSHFETQDFREENLLQLCEEIRKSGVKSEYDCVVPIRGDADDYHVVSVVLKNKLRPLLIGVNSYFMNDIGWHNLQNLQTHFDLDMEYLHPNLKQYRDLVRYSLAKYDDIFIPYQFVFHSFVKLVAIKKKIKYILYGENQPTEQTGNFSNFDYPEKSRWFHEVFDFRNFSLEEFLGTGSSWSLSNLPMYKYPEQKKKYPKGVFLSNYIRWDSASINAKMRQFGFISEKQSRTYDSFHRAGFSHYYEIHDFLRYKKYGYIKARDHLCRDIRMGHISREEASYIYDYYLSVPFNLDGFLNWIGANEIGKKWLEKHKLKTKAISSCATLSNLEFLKTFSPCTTPSQHYLPYHKALHIVKGVENV